MAISRITAEWTGFAGAPGYSTFYFAAFGGGDLVNLEVQRVHDAFTQVRGWLPDSVTISVRETAEILDEETGELTGYSSSDLDLEPVEGDGANRYSGPVGAVVHWNTDTVARGRRLRGRTFLVPLESAAFGFSGSLNSNAQASVADFAQALEGDGTGPDLVVWSRPRDGAGGSIGPVTSWVVPSLSAVLRSRRD